MSGAESLSPGAAPPEDISAPPLAGRRDPKGAPTSPRRTWPFFVLAVILVIVIAGVAAYEIHIGTHASGGGTGTQLAPRGANFTISPEQFNAIDFVTKSNASVNGTIYEAGGLVVYLMTPAELDYLSVKGNISGYAWTSGGLGDYAEYGLSISVAPGAWDVVFLSPNAIVTELDSYLVYVTNIDLVS